MIIDMELIIDSLRESARQAIAKAETLPDGYRTKWYRMRARNPNNACFFQPPEPDVSDIMQTRMRAKAHYLKMMYHSARAEEMAQCMKKNTNDEWAHAARYYRFPAAWPMAL